MCGIVGYVGHRPALELLVQGLKRLEYRGYDSAGVAYFHDKKIEIHKSEGKLERVEKILSGRPSHDLISTCGIGHTRWATHGKPTTQNAHPHRTGHVVLVHNGIIENYLEIKKELLSRGHRPASETDSELFGFLVLEEMDRGASLAEGVRKAFTRVRGQCSVVVISEREPGVVVGVRNGSPLAAANDPQGGAMVASDAQPLLQITQDVYFLENGDQVVCTEKGLEFFDVVSGKRIERRPTRVDWSLERLGKQGFDHYMIKEIHEQPTAIVDTLNGLLDRAGSKPFTFAEHPALKLIHGASELNLVACGSSWHAALLGKYWMEKWGKIRVNVELASEFRYRQPFVDPKGVLVGITQSGETADVLAVIAQAKAMKIPTIGITNVRGSTLSREADATFYTSAGPEICVLSTKAFICQMATLVSLAGLLGAKQSDPAGIQSLFDDLIRLPHLLSRLLQPEFLKSFRSAARALNGCKGFFFIGRGYSFPLALEGALKLKEVTYVHAEGYAGGELKHGPIAMIDEKMAVVVLAPKDRWREKTVSNLEEVKARGAFILGVGDDADEQLKSLCDQWIGLPDLGRLDESLLPFLLTPSVQLLSYELALLKGTDVDQPRNLAKSVTVE